MLDTGHVSLVQSYASAAPLRRIGGPRCDDPKTAAGQIMAQVAFLLNGTPVHLADVDPTQTLLDYVRETAGLKGTKEGCNEGDCGACTVMVSDGQSGARALNSCIPSSWPNCMAKRFARSKVWSGPNGEAHPVQEAMVVAHHGSQCGFCTPGFVVWMATAHLNGDIDHAYQTGRKP